MTLRPFLKTIGSGAALAAVVLVGMFITSPRGQASGGSNHGQDDASKIKRGFAIAPVPLNMAGKNPALVGLGSYIVNAQGDCNGCHSAGPATEFVPGRNPYFRDQTEKINPATYLGGGRVLPPIAGTKS